jgi:anaerobic magnesium-protoporphyrin IX monomethyl ester cyclase
MKILLLAMPDTSRVFNYSIKLPNLGLVSVAGSLAEHEVRVVDLVLHAPKIRRVVERELSTFRPDLVGMSAMTFQFDSLVRVARFVREHSPGTRLAAGGYHATTMANEITAPGSDLPLDYLVRGEGEATFRELIEALDHDNLALDAAAGLSYRNGDAWMHNPDRPLLDLARLPLPNRSARPDRGFHILTMPADVVEFSRGCPFVCKFCSIRQMYGKTYRRFPVSRVLEDLSAIKAGGAKCVFIVDDNVSYDAEHFQGCLKAICAHGLNDLIYFVQVTAVSVARNPHLVSCMDRANVRAAFVGFESMSSAFLNDMKKPSSAAINQRAAELLRQHGIGIVAGFITGHPDDTRESLVKDFRAIRALKPDLFYPQYLTPYPKTEIREELLAAGLVENRDDFSQYDGYTCNVRTRNLTRTELEKALQWESLKPYFDPPHIARNLFVRRMPGPFVASQLKVLATLVAQSLGRKREREIDL